MSSLPGLVVCDPEVTRGAGERLRRPRPATDLSAAARTREPRSTSAAAQMSCISRTSTIRRCGFLRMRSTARSTSRATARRKTRPLVRVIEGPVRARMSGSEVGLAMVRASERTLDTIVSTSHSKSSSGSVSFFRWILTGTMGAMTSPVASSSRNWLSPTRLPVSKRNATSDERGPCNRCHLFAGQPTSARARPGRWDPDDDGARLFQEQARAAKAVLEPDPAFSGTGCSGPGARSDLDELTVVSLGPVGWFDGHRVTRFVVPDCPPVRDAHSKKLVYPSSRSWSSILATLRAARG